MSAVDDEVQGANAVMSRSVTPFRHAKSLPEAISLTSTPRKIFSTDVSAADGADARSCESRRSPMSPSRISSEVYTSSRRTGSRRHSSSSEEQAAAISGFEDESDLVSIARCKMDATAILHAPIAKMKTRKAVDAPAVKPIPPPSASFKRPSRSSSHPPRKAQPATARVPGTQTGTATAPSPFSSLKCFSQESAQPPSNLSLQTASPLPQVNKTPRSWQSPVTRPKSDMSSVARSNIHLSVLADLLDKKVFSEEDVLLELEAIRKRSLLTSAPFNKRLLPILAWYLLRDKFGDEAATRYVSLLTSPMDASRHAGAVSATFSIASFLPRVNEIRRMRREAKERNRKKPKHHYAIVAPASPTDRAKMSHATHAHRQRRQRRRTAAFDALKDASDIPTTSTASLCSPQLSNTPGSLCMRNLSPQSYGRLRVYTCEHAFFDRQQAKAEDRPVIDVVVDAADRQARAKNTFELIEEEPSVFLGPEQRPSAAKGPAADSTSKKFVPVPPASARSHGALGEAMAHRRHGMQLREGEGCDMLEETLSMGTLSEVGRAKEGEEGLSLFYRECVEGCGGECMPSVSAFWQAITPCHPSAASYPHSRRGLPAKHPQHRQADRDAGVMDVTAAVMPCVSNILAAADCGANAQRSERLSETVNSPDLSTVAGDTTRAEISVEYSLGVASEHQLYNDNASAAPQGGAASQAPTNTTTRSALNGLHKPLGGAYAAGNDTESASCSATSPSLRDWSAARTSSLCAPEPNQTLKRQQEERPYSYLSSAENSLNNSVTATQYYSMLPNASAVTHKPGCSLRSCREARQVNGSAEFTILPLAIKPEGSVEKSFDYGALLEDRADTVETSETESVTSTESADSGSCAAVEYSAFISAETSAMVPSVTSGVQLSATKPNERRPRRAAAEARSVLEHSSQMANPVSQGTLRVRGTSPISVSRIWDSDFHSVGGGGSKAKTRGRTGTESGLRSTSAYRMFDSRCPPPITISGPTYTASASSEKSCFGSLLGTDVETSTAGGSDHQRGSLLEPFDSVTLRNAAAYTGSARQGDYNVNADDSLPSSNAHRSSVGEHSSNQDRQHKHSLQDCASPPSTAGARRTRSASHAQLRTYRGAQERCAPLDVPPSPLAHSPGVYDQRTDALTPHSAAPRTPLFGHAETSPTCRWTTSRGGYGSVMEGDGSLAPNARCAAPPSGGYSIGGRSVSSLQSCGGYGSVMEGDGSLAPNARCAAPPSGGYSIGGRSVSSLQSCGGYGSVMEGDGSLAPNARCAAPPSGGYSIGGRSVSSLQSCGGYGSVMEGDGSLAPNARCAAPPSGGYSIGGRSVSSLQSCGGYGSVMEGDGSLAPNARCAAPPSGGYSTGGRSVSSLQSCGGYGSVMEGDGSLAPNARCAAPPSGGYSIGGRSVSSLQSCGGYGSVMEGDGSLAPNARCAAPPSGGYSIGGRSVSSLQSCGGYGSVMEGDGSLAPNARCAAPPSGGYSIGGRSVSSLQSCGGYGSVMEGDGSLAPNARCAAPPSGGYSIGGRSVSSLQSCGGYGSVMEGDGSLAPNARCAAPPSGGYSIGGRSVSTLQSRDGYSFARGGSFSGSASFVSVNMREKIINISNKAAGSLVTAPSGHSCGARLSSASKQCDGGVPESTVMNHRSPNAVSPRAGKAVESDIASLVAPDAVFRAENDASRPLSKNVSAENQTRPAVAASEDTAVSTCTALRGSGGGRSEMLSSTMDPVELTAALQRLGERQTLCWEENNACTFGEVGCQCATGKGHVPITAYTKQAPRQPCSAPVRGAEARAHGVDGIVVGRSPTENTLAAASPNAASPVPLPLGEKLLNDAPQHENRQRKSRCCCVGVCTQSNGPQAHVGAHFRLHPSPAPVRGTANVSAQQSSVNASSGSPADTITGAPTESMSQGRCKNRNRNHAGSVLNGDGFTSGVTILSEPRSSADLSVHKLPDSSALRGDVRIQQPRERQCADSAVASHCRARYPMPAATSILHNSCRSSRINEPEKTKTTERTEATAAAAPGVSYYGDLTVAGSATAAGNVAMCSIPPFPLPPDATVVNPAADAIDEEPLRMPHNMTGVLLGEGSHSGCFSGMQAAQETAAVAHDADATGAVQDSCEVHIRHANLTTLLAHSRLGSSHVIVDRASVLEAPVVAARPGLASTGRLRSVEVSRSENMVLDYTATGETHAGRSDALSENAPSTGSDRDGSGDSEGACNTRKYTQLANRRIAHRPPLHPSKCRRTILDIADVPYVDSPDVSMHTDTREALRKKQERDLLVMRWARRGLLWQRQENEAQRYEEYQCRVAAGKGFPGVAAATEAKPILHGELLLHRPGRPNGLRPSAPMQPRAHGSPPPRRHH
ncbi:hypothetical protein CUR178_02786 [Leishmania enriettii]|uniref:Uncharacterized protein n=1 Tax=Leishmania enriettii TaxID=5663 RepID=A0A836KDA9_LEIEN|nr:hypothetical protein CUR178_02786 [Leishmania enriettii]